MSKKKIENLQKQYSKPQLTRWQKQQKQQHWVLIIGIVIIVAVLALVSVGYYMNEWKPLHTTVLTVNDKKFTMSDYLKVLRGLSTEQTDYISTFAEYAGTYLGQAEIIKQAAAEEGITVSGSEIKEEMKNTGAAGGLEPIVQAQLLAKKLHEEFFKPEVPTSAVQADIAAMFLESEDAAKAVLARLAAGTETFDDIAAAESLDNTTKSNKGEMGWHPQDALSINLGSTIPGDFAFAESSAIGQLSEPLADTVTTKQLGYWLIYVIEKGTGDYEGQINVRAMLLSSLQEANEIKSQLDAISETAAKAEKFTELAKQKSQYTNAASDGGLLGMISTGTMGDTFDNVAFSLDVGMVSDPVQDTAQITKGGYWLVKINDKAESKELTEDDITTIAYNKYSEWLGTVQADAKVTDNISNNDAAKEWAIARVKKDLGVS